MSDPPEGEPAVGGRVAGHAIAHAGQVLAAADDVIAGRAQHWCGRGGRLAAQVGAHLLERPHGGRGVLIGGCTGVQPARVVVLGAGTVGWNAARLAAAMDAEVLLLDRSPERLRRLEADRRGRLMSVVSSRGLLERLVPSADLLIGAVLTPGGRAPTLVDEAMVEQMRPGSVIVDVAIDQGGCVATSQETQQMAKNICGVACTNIRNGHFKSI